MTDGKWGMPRNDYREIQLPNHLAFRAINATLDRFERVESAAAMGRRGSPLKRAEVYGVSRMVRAVNQP